jgi:hypothetical protein
MPATGLLEPACHTANIRFTTNKEEFAGALHETPQVTKCAYISSCLSACTSTLGVAGDL